MTLALCRAHRSQKPERLDKWLFLENILWPESNVESSHATPSPLKAQMPLRNKYNWHTETYHFLTSFDCGTNPILTMTLIFKTDLVSIWLNRSYMCNNSFQRVSSEATQCIRHRILIWEFNLGHLFNPLNSPQNPTILWPLKDKGTRYSSKTLWL